MDNKSIIKLETDHLIIRRFTENDINALFGILQDDEVNTYLPWFPLKSIKEADEFFQEKYASAYKQNWEYKYAICLKTDNIPIGYVNISMDDSHDLGYGLIKKLWHNGIVTEACKTILEQVKKDALLPYITATHDIKNFRSGNVMKQLGMSYKYSYEEQCQPKNTLVTFRLYQLNLDGQDDRVYQKYWDKYETHFIEKNI